MEYAGERYTGRGAAAGQAELHSERGDVLLTKTGARRTGKIRLSKPDFEAC